MIKILVGDCRDKLKELPAGSVQCVVTSPPYFSLRDYGHDNQIGLESLHDCLGWATGNECGECYVCEMVNVFREVKRVLRDDGVLFLNLGDSYYGSGQTGGTNSKEGSAKRKGRMFTRSASVRRAAKKTAAGNGLKEKDLMGIPWRVALALQADGWYLRSEIIWHKENGMPESVTDRPTKAHEQLFLLTKRPKYYYDKEAIKEPIAESTIGRGPVSFGGAKGRGYQPNQDDPNYRNGSEQWGRTFDYTTSCASGRNKRSVWSMPNQPFSGAHFAVFPTTLVEPCIKAGTSEHGACPACGAPYRRVVEKSEPVLSQANPVIPYAPPGQSPNGKGATTLHMVRETKTTDWRPSCECDAGDPVPCVVLDPFGGSGTTGLVADRLGRDAILIELNPDYAVMAQKRIEDDSPLFANVESECVAAEKREREREALPLLAYANTHASEPAL